MRSYHLSMEECTFSYNEWMLVPTVSLSHH